MLYVISVLVATVIVILILIHAKLKLLLEWAKSTNGRCDSTATAAWSVSRTVDLLWSHSDKKPQYNHYP